MTGPWIRSAGPEVPLASWGSCPPPIWSCWRSGTRPGSSAMSGDAGVAVPGCGGRPPGPDRGRVRERQLTYAELERMARGSPGAWWSWAPGRDRWSGCCASDRWSWWPRCTAWSRPARRTCRSTPSTRPTGSATWSGETEMRVVLAQGALPGLVTDRGVVWWISTSCSRPMRTPATRRLPCRARRPGLRDLHVGLDRPAQGRGQHPPRHRQPAAVDAGRVRRWDRTTWCCRRRRSASTCRCGSSSGRCRPARGWWSPRPAATATPAYLVETIVRHGVDTVHFVPSMLRLFLDHPARRLVRCAAARDLSGRGADPRPAWTASSRCCPLPSCTTSTARPRPRST